MAAHPQRVDGQLLEARQVFGIEPGAGDHAEGEGAHAPDSTRSAAVSAVRQSAARQNTQRWSAHSSADHGSAPMPMACAYATTRRITRSASRAGIRGDTRGGAVDPADVVFDDSPVRRERQLGLRRIQLRETEALPGVEPQAAVGLRLRAHEDRELDHDPQLLDRIGLTGCDRLHLLDAVLDVLLEHRQQELVLAPEVPVERLQGDAGAVGELADRELPLALDHEGLPGPDELHGGIAPGAAGSLLGAASRPQRRAQLPTLARPRGVGAELPRTRHHRHRRRPY